MSFHERIDEARGRLTRTDRALLDEILGHPADSPLWRGEEVAGRAGVHPAAATRLAQRLGYQGYPQLRDALRADLGHGLTGAGDRFRAELREHRDQGVLDSLLASELDSLAAVSRHVTQDQIDGAADAIIGARRVFVFARGNSTVLADLLDRRLRRFGLQPVCLSGSGREVAERILSMGEGDLLVAFAFRRPPRNLTDLLAHCGRVGAGSLLVTDTLHTLDPSPARILAAPRGTQEGFASLAVPMMIANAIVLTIAQRHPDTALPALDRLDGLLAEFD